MRSREIFIQQIRRLAPLVVVFGAMMGCAPAATRPAASAAAGAPAATAAAAHPDVAGLGWLVGDWASASGDVMESWSAAGDALLGVSLAVREGRTVHWEALIIRRDVEGLALEAMPEGSVPVLFRLGPTEAQAATFANPAHDFPQTIRYERSEAAGGRSLRARIASEARTVELAYRARPEAPAPALEAADREFAADTARRGAIGWAEAFDPSGAMGRPTRRIEGRDAIRAAMEPLFKDGRLDWAPVRSGLSPAGDIGFTVGRYRAFSRSATGEVESGSGAYVSIWKRGDDGRWRVLFDMGEPMGVAPVLPPRPPAPKPEPAPTGSAASATSVTSAALAAAD